MAHIKFNSKKYEIPAGSTAQQTFESLKLVMPDMANARLTKDGDNWVAKNNFAEKG